MISRRAGNRGNDTCDDNRQKMRGQAFMQSPRSSSGAKTGLWTGSFHKKAIDRKVKQQHKWYGGDLAKLLQHPLPNAMLYSP